MQLAPTAWTAFALALVGALMAPATVYAQEAAALAAPAADTEARPDATPDTPDAERRLFVRSEARHDSARVERLRAPAGAEHEWRCDTPCTLTLAPGAYRIWMTAVALDELLTIDANDTFVEGCPGSSLELAFGVGVGVLGVALLSYALLTGEGACFDFGASCPTVRGPLALGAGAFAIGVGIGLMFDSAGYIDITSVRP